MRVNLLICLNQAACYSPADKQARGLFQHICFHTLATWKISAFVRPRLHAQWSDCYRLSRQPDEKWGELEVGGPTRCLKIAVTSCGTASWTKCTADGRRTEREAAEGTSKVTGRSQQSSRRQCVSLRWPRVPRMLCACCTDARQRAEEEENTEAELLDSWGRLFLEMMNKN